MPASISIVCKIQQILRYHIIVVTGWVFGTIKMKRQELMLAALSTAGQRCFSPVQVQKLFFLIDRRLAKGTGGPHFDFQPYDYGPFDQIVYQELDVLHSTGYVDVSDGSPWDPRQYSLTDSGLQKGKEILAKLESPTQSGISRLADFVRSVSFGQLVSAIYREYPETKVNSVFNG